MESMQIEYSPDWAATAMESMQLECSLGVVAKLEKINDAVEAMRDQCSLGLVAEAEPVNDAVEGSRQEECFVRVAANLRKAKDMAKQLEALFAAQQQQGGGGDAAAGGGGYQQVRALTSTICSSIDRALHMITSKSNRADGGPAPAWQPASMPSSGGDGSSHSAVSDKGGGNAPAGPGQSNPRKTLPKRSTQVRVCSVQHVSALDDGLSWRKYGQKDVLGAKHPRAYFHAPAHAGLPREQAGAAHGR